MTGINWLVLIMSGLIVFAFFFGQKVERERQRLRDLKRRHAAKAKQDQDLTREYW